MSDLISTPSQTQSIVSNEAFEALIDLLASDGIEENPSTLPGDRAGAQPNVTLRDSSGKLDFDRIRLMFAAQNESPVSAPPGRLDEEKNCAESSAVPNEDGDSDDDPNSPPGTSSTVPSRPASVSPRPTERPATGHRRSSTFGNEPSAAIHNAMALKVENVASALLHQPLSLDELNTALASAHEEVTHLRRQYDELEAFVSKHLGAQKRDQIKLAPGPINTDKMTLDTGGGRVETRVGGSHAQPNADLPSAPLPPDVPTEIASLSENEAKTVLSALARSLNLSPSTIGSMISPSTSTGHAPHQQGLCPPSPARQHDVASITRAIKFLSIVDELVWRRASGPPGPRPLLPVFSEENFVSLVARLELWERAVRRSSRV